MSNTVNDSAIKKLKLLFTVVDRPKGEFYLDVISQFDVNCQMAVNGLGTATSELVELLGLEPHKAVILSVVREDMVDTIMNTLEDKFATIRNGKGVAFAVPLIANFDEQDAQVAVNLPTHAFDYFKLPTLESIEATELLTGTTLNVTLDANAPVHLTVPGWSGAIVKFTLPEIEA